MAIIYYQWSAPYKHLLSPLCTPLHAWQEQPSNRYAEVSEYQLEPKTEDSRCAYLFPADDDLFLGGSDHLYVRRQLHPRRYGDIVESLEPVFIPQRLPGRKRTCELGALDIQVVRP
jgi:hypothetical protein